MTDLKNYEPDEAVAGDLWSWKKSVPGYPASEGWALTYHFANSSANFSISASGDGADFLVEVTPENPAPGLYNWAATVKKGAARITVGSGSITVHPDPESGSADLRSYAQKIVDAIEAVIEKRASKDQENYSIDGRSLARTPIADLLLLRDRFRKELANEKAKNRIAQGRKSRRNIRLRFK